MGFNDKVSTARRVAFARSWESHRPAEERVCFDPFARDFLNWVGRFFSANPLGRRMTLKSGSELEIAILGYVPLRTKIIDDYALECAKNGLKQLVILGAGYDARAYRLEDLRVLDKIFELDLGQRQDKKLAILTKKLGELPGHVTYVPIDFESQTLQEALLEAGFSPDLKSLFIWEGVSYYLEQEAVEQTLAFVANMSAPGSAIVFDYLHAGVIDGTSQDPMANALMEYGARIGEPYKFGLRPEKVGEFMRDRGFARVEHFTSEQCKRKYCGPTQQDREVISLFYLVKAATGDQAQGAGG